MRYLLALVLVASFAGTAQANFWGNWQKCEKGKGQVAIKACSWLIKSGKLKRFQAATVYLRRGLAQMGRGHPRLAILDYTKVIRISPREATSYNYRAWAYTVLKKYKMAFVDYKKAIHLSPISWNAYLAYSNRGNLFRKLGQYQEAIQNYSKAIRVTKLLKEKSETASLYYIRGLTYMKLSRYKHAVTDLTEVIRHAPKAGPPHRDRGWAYFKMGQASKALPDIEKAWLLVLVRKSTNRMVLLSDIRIKRGHIYAALGKRGLAIKDFRAALKLGKGDAGLIKSAREGLAKLGVKP